MKRASQVAALALAGVLLVGCGRTTINLDRDNLDREIRNDGEFETINPYAFADRFGEPDVWRNDGETHGGLTMTQIWRCLEGDYREITWRMVQRPQGGMAWTPVNDITRDGECEEPGKAPADSTAASGEAAGSEGDASEEDAAGGDPSAAGSDTGG
jgi:hypothetical protein